MKNFELEMKSLNYKDISSKLQKLDDSALLILLGSKYTKIGDSAFTHLRRRNCYKAVADAIVADQFKLKPAKIRATNLLLFDGCKAPWAINAYCYLLKDENEAVAGNALFGIVFSLCSDCLNAIRIRLRNEKLHAKFRQELELAIRAIKERNPYLYAPNYRDSDGIWTKQEGPI